MTFYTDQQLIEMIQTPTAREAALYYLFRWKNARIRTQIIAFVKLRGGNHQDGEDITQDAFVIAERNVQRGTFRQESALPTYIISIGKWLWVNHLRREKSALHLLEIEPALVTVVEKSVEDAYIEQERKALIENAILQLPQPCHAALRMYNLRFSFQEIQSTLQYPTVKQAENQVYRCLERLKTFFK